MKHILIANNHDSFVYNLVELLRHIPECASEVHYTEEITSEMMNRCDGLLLSPGPGLPDEQPNLMNLIARYHATVPMLGVCLGHQALAGYFGAELICLSAPLHGHIDVLTHVDEKDCLLHGLPPQAHIGRYHSWIVDEETVPRCLCVTAHAQSDNSIMAFRHRDYPLFGVQFHPESYMSDGGAVYLRNFLSVIGH